MTPTRIYVRPVLDLLRQVEVRGLAHITGGGLTENVPRILPEALTAQIEARAWPRPALFDWLQRQGGVADAEMFRVFNCGVGMVAAVPQAQASRALELLRAAGEQAWQIGRIRARHPGEPQTLIA